MPCAAQWSKLLVRKIIFPQIIKIFNLVYKPVITISYSQPIIHVLIQMDPFGMLTSYFFKNNFNTILPSLPSSQVLSSLGVSLTKALLENIVS